MLGFVTLLLVVVPGMAGATSSFSDIVGMHINWCPSNLKSCPGQTNLTNPCCAFCGCNLEECNPYGTCCLSEYGSFEAAHESVSQTLYTCVDPNVYTYDERYPPVHYPLSGHQLIVRCNSSTPDPRIRDLCENPDVDRDLETLFPVTDFSTRLVYRNQYCALCNDQADFDSIRRWDIETDCNKSVMLTYEHMYRVIKERQCNVTFKPPKKKALLVACIPYTISTCNVSGLWQVYNETLELACNSFIDPFNFTYKNVFCFLCNIDTSESVNMSKCQAFKQGGQPVSGVNPPFFAMLDLSAVLTKQTNKQIQCNDHEQYRDDKMGVCRDIQCDQTQYLSFEGSCVLKSDYANPLCYILLLKLTPLDYFRLSKSFAKSIADHLMQDMNSTAIEIYAKETVNDDAQVEYVIFKLLTDSVSAASTAISLLQGESNIFGSGMRMQLVSYNISLFNGQLRLEVPSKHFETRDVLVKVGYNVSTKTDSCIDKSIVYADNLLKCKFVQLKFTEIQMSFINGTLVFLDINSTSLSWLDYRHVNDSILICLRDYKVIYESLPEIAKNETPRFFTEISLKNLISLLCVCMSIVCLLATVVMFIVTPSLHSHPGLNTLVLCMCLLLAQTVYQFGVGQTSLPGWSCSMIGAICHLLWLSVMFAMNVCSLDMFMIFRKLTKMRFESPCRKVIKRLMYILTLSILFVSINIIVSLSKSGGKHIGYGGIICYISSRVMQIVTFVVPSVLTILTNITLFIFVVIKIKKASIKSAGLNQERNYFEIYARLSTLTGFTWIVGFILLLIQNEILEYLFILLNASQGLFIMIAFIFNKRVWKTCCGKRSDRGSTRSDRGSTRVTTLTS